MEGLPASDNSSNFTTLYQQAKIKQVQMVSLLFDLWWPIQCNLVLVELMLRTLVGARDLQLVISISLAA